MTDSPTRLVVPGGIDYYMSIADKTAQELLASENLMVMVLREYDTYFRERLWQADQPSALPLMLQMNAYQLFLASSRMALSGHSAAVFPLLRTALESAAYAGLMIQNPDLEQVWSSRHLGETDAEKRIFRKACSKDFNFRKAIESLKTLQAHAPNILEYIMDCYEHAIDHGAHPNIIGVFSHVTIDNQRADDGLVAANFTSLYSTFHIETIRGLCACLDYGFAIISIIALSRLSISDALLEELDHLVDAKEEATTPYSAES
ncbi:hypothetical protein [Pseudomonas sp. S3E17]|uniref:hypothetical protein n=1 Tax=Pseudomonas sp. S3E17 TaxID=2817893 RepID=UPI00209F3BB5|nr:hypothetical protein [Pseudomonas sp. S3E17]MCP1463313.1 hypothetical protein [Pseudomonas sp. S3E17]